MLLSEIFLSTLSLRRATLSMPSGNTNSLNFYPRSPCGERPAPIICTLKIKIFLSTLSLRRATRPHYLHSETRDISIHALLAESDVPCWALYSSSRYFYPRSPCGERPDCLGVVVGASQHFYPRSPCGERRVFYVNVLATQIISIHALLAESDRQTLRLLQGSAISIHALLAESDSVTCGRYCQRHYFYPRSPCGERRKYRLNVAPAQANFYPRSPCGERPYIIDGFAFVLIFLSTLSLRRATYQRQIHQKSRSISIHALLAESDGWFEVIH